MKEIKSVVMKRKVECGEQSILKASLKFRTIRILRQTTKRSFSIESSSTTENLSIQTLIEDIRLVGTEKRQFENR